MLSGVTGSTSVARPSFGLPMSSAAFPSPRVPALPLPVPPPPIEGTIFNQRTQVPLARGKVRHVGEPVAMVVAESRYVAEDAVADIGVEYQPLPAVTDLERALALATFEPGMYEVVKTFLPTAPRPA